MRHLMLIAALTTSAAACSTKPQLHVDQCSAWSPIIPSNEDRLTDGTAEQILLHDCIGVQLCGWGKDRPAMQKACTFK